MALKRMVLEIGMGTDIRGADSTKAAERAVRDALWRNTLSIATLMGKERADMHLEINIGVPRPETVNKEAVLAALSKPTPERILYIGQAFREGLSLERIQEATIESRPRAGAATGLLAGGALVELLDWRWVFLINVPVALLVVPAVRRTASARAATLKLSSRTSSTRNSDL